MAGIADYEHVERLSAANEATSAALACAGLFAVCGFGLVRLALPAELRRHELLWVLPAGACAAAIELSVLGQLGVPLPLNLAVVALANVALAVVAVRRRGLPGRDAVHAGVAWPVWIAALLIFVALVPMFRAGFATVQGYGSDAHLAAGTGHFLKEHAPGQVAPEEPVDMVPLVWRSKPPIYYPMATTSLLTGLETWEVLSTVLAVMLALAALGFFLLAREALGAGLGGAVVAMSVVGLDRVVLHTALHPYYNQTWGFFTLPFALLLAYWTTQARTRGSALLLVLFLAVGAFAYPLALPIPLIALAVLLWPERRRLRRLRPSRRSLLWLVPLGVVLFGPVAGVVEKVVSAAFVVLDPSRSLRAWGGDLKDGFVPEHQFLAMPSTTALLVLGVPLLVALVLELRRQPRGLAIAFAGILLFGAIAAAWFRPRAFGEYFHFKTLAFVAPLAVMLAVVGVSRLRRRFAAVALTVLLALAVVGAQDELMGIYDQTPPTLLALRDLDAALPPGASVRLDVAAGEQPWVGYMLASQPLCSEFPLRGTSYPHVPISRKADFVLVKMGWGRPVDALGDPVWAGEDYTLYRVKPTVPGPDRCSQRMVQTVTYVPIT